MEGTCLKFSARRNHDGSPCDCPDDDNDQLVRRLTLTSLLACLITQPLDEHSAKDHLLA